MAKLSDKELGAILEAEKADALSTDASDIAEQRSEAMRYYNGDMKADMPSIEGRSKAVSLDVYDTIESMLPDLVEIFASGEEVVKFNAVGPEDVPLAQQETEYVNHVFMQKNPGFLVLYSMMKDALLSKVGVVKVHWEKSEDEERETYLDQPEDVFALVQSKPDVEVVEHTPHDGMHDFTIVSRKAYGCAKVEPVPPEEFGISRRARSLRDCSYCFHEVSRSEQDLIDDGFDADQVRELPSFGEEQKEEANARDTVNEGSSGSGDSSLNTAMRPIRVTEHYIRMRYDGETARLYRVTTGGEAGKVLYHKGEPAVVPIDMIPFAAITPVIVTHRFHGKSIADLVMEIQRIKTALLRALLDNAYLAVNPMTEVAEDIAGDSTIDDLLVRRPGGLVRVKQAGAVKVIEHPGVGDDVFPLLEHQDSVREWRTGVTRQGTGLDANALNNQSATAANQLHNAAKARLRLIARIFAETGIKDLFWLLHGTIRKNASQADTVELSNKWVTVDPRQWKTRKDLTATVGLGTGSKAEQMVAVQTVAAYQEKLMLGGLSNMVSPQNLWNTAKDLTKLAGKKDPGYYFTDPSTTPPPEPKPDPEMVKIQGQLEVEKIQAQADIALSEKKLQSDMQKIAAELAQSREMHQMTMQMEREKHQIKMMEMRYKTIADSLKTAQGGANGEGGEGQAPDRSAALAHELMLQLHNMNRPKRVRRMEDGSWVSEPEHGGGSGPQAPAQAMLGDVMSQLQEMNKPRRVRKLEDGSWVAEPVH
jgi:hypothetical protein